MGFRHSGPSYYKIFKYFTGQNTQQVAYFGLRYRIVEKFGFDMNNLKRTKNYQRSKSKITIFN